MNDGDWMKFYYADPTPERFLDEVRALGSRPEMSNAGSRFVAATFFGRVMAANVDRVPAWLEALSDLRGTARELVHTAAWLSDTDAGRAYLERANAAPALRRRPPDILTRPIEDPVMLDALWSHYFATGDERAVRRVVTALEHLGDLGAAAAFQTSAKTAEDRARAVRDAIYQAASWSISSLAKEHAPLAAMCDRMLDAPDLSPNERVSLAMALQRVDAARWKVDIDPKTGTARISRSVA